METREKAFEERMDCDAPKPGGPVDNLSTREIPMDFG